MKNLKFAGTVFSIRQRINQDESGVLAFEWLLVLTVLVIGIVAGIATMRDSVSLKMLEAAQVVHSVDTSYEIPEYESRLAKDEGAQTATVTQKSPTLYSSAGSSYAERKENPVSMKIDSASLNPDRPAK
ncbi:MAG: hypothetical protein IJF17_05545 [Thermoguttaceae bacterium]|nr:hypothetical protein [Thermoguttaceae bacterium]